MNHILNEIFQFCINVLTYLGHEFGISYFGTNVILFDIIGPAVFLIFSYLIVNRKTKHPYILGFLAVSSYVICFLHFYFFRRFLPPWYFFPAMLLLLIFMILKRKKASKVWGFFWGCSKSLFFAFSLLSFHFSYIQDYMTWLRWFIQLYLYIVNITELDI